MATKCRMSAILWALTGLTIACPHVGVMARLLPGSSTLAAASSPQPAPHTSSQQLPHYSPPKVVPCEQPVARAPVRFPASLVGRAPHTFDMSSGYINVTAQDYLFYWLHGPQIEGGADTPIILWSNGGPGCSAMEGATTENGPLNLFNIKVGLSAWLTP
eukprot:COSAG01_NODE_29998_length_625_cov_1.342205_1_plen_159_part_00